MWSWLRRQRDALTPVMFRVRNPQGAVVDVVELEGVFDRRSRVRTRKRTADGLCQVHWPEGSTRLDVTFTHDEGSASLTVRSDRKDPHRVVEVMLAAPAE
jgi:hypothetical protein